MFAWGSNINGELGLNSDEEEEYILTPRQIHWNMANEVIECASGDNHSVFLTKNGKVYSASNNDYGQLRHNRKPRKRPQSVAGLDAYNITHIACGAAHSVALSQRGQAFSWGSDSHGQLGQQLDENSLLSIPKIVRSLISHHLVQLVCGQRHTIALSSNGDILAWGANNFGQLGFGLFSERERFPKVVTSLKGVPIALIACGANHTFALSKSGAVYAWGKNTKGQLGLNDMNNRIFPTQLRILRNLKVKYIACGEEFSVFLTLDGGIFTCGSGTYGQLGHGSNSNEIVPKQVIELMGSTITQVVCGRQHCLVLVPSSRPKVYGFGIGNCGQLGLKNTSAVNTPQAILGPWISKDINVQNLIVRRIFAGGDCCFLTVVSEDKKNISSFDNRDYSADTQIVTITKSFIRTLLRTPIRDPVDQEALNILEVAFKSVACLNGSFLTESDEHYTCSSRHHGIDIVCAEMTFDLIGKIENESIKYVIWTGITEGILKELTPNPPDVETLRIYILLPLYQEFSNPKHYLKLHKPLVNAAFSLSISAFKVIEYWFSLMPSNYFEKLVNNVKNVVDYMLRNQEIPSHGTAFYDATLVSMLDMMTFLNKINGKINGLKVPYHIFYINGLHDYLDVGSDYCAWLMEYDTSGKLFLCNYPFIFNAEAKLHLLQTDQHLQMQQAMESAAQNAFLHAMFDQGQWAHNQFLMLNINRENIADDTLRQLRELDSNDLKKPLKVRFEGEEAEDVGGVTKEFFMLVLREVLDPKYGLFKEYQETKNIWFSDSSFEDNHVYFLIGMICGLAIYNFTIVDLPFPLALYKKLLNEPVNLNDLQDLSPAIFKSLKTLLDYEKDDLQETFCLSFHITKDVWGEVVVIELKPNGSNIPVIQVNKKEYVSLYIDYIFNKAVKRSYDVFEAGFMKVCGGRVLKLFHSHELMAIVAGNENYDWHALEQVAIYKHGYKSSDKTIKYFWEVIHEMPLEDKKKFLLFLTGTCRIPIQGMTAIKIIIQPTNDDKFLPVAHTCFNLLDLPRYKTKEELKHKLLQAIQQTEGFSLV